MNTDMRGVVYDTVFPGWRDFNGRWWHVRGHGRLSSDEALVKYGMCDTKWMVYPICRECGAVAPGYEHLERKTRARHVADLLYKDVPVR